MFRRVVAVGARLPWGGGDDDRRPDEVSTDRTGSEVAHRQSGPDESARGTGAAEPAPESDEGDPPPLGAVTERRTLADVIDATALAHRLPAAWTARTTVTKFGEDAVTEVLELSGRGHRLAVDPERTVAPEGPATCYERPAGAARRRQIATADSLGEALAITLDRITSLDERVEPVMPAGQGAADPADVLETVERGAD
jgi:hypothetical protein